MVINEERARDPKHSGATIFSGKIRCGCCGGWYGSKVWHSNDKYRRVVWQGFFVLKNSRGHIDKFLCV